MLPCLNLKLNCLVKLGGRAGVAVTLVLPSWCATRGGPELAVHDAAACAHEASWEGTAGRLCPASISRHRRRMSDVDSEADEFLEEVTRDEVAEGPESADPQWLVDKMIPEDIRSRYEVYSYRSAATILAEGNPREFAELCEALRKFEITTTMMRTAGGNESDIPKLLSAVLRPLGWNETIIQGDLLVKLTSKQQVDAPGSTKPRFQKLERTIRREKYLDGHKVDYVKGRVAFDLEWNSKDQTFDRDLYAFSAFAQCGVVDVGVLVTRGTELNDLIGRLGPALTKSGGVELTKAGVERTTKAKYGASTTWMGKLLYRLNAGRNGACPVLAIGIKSDCVTDRDTVVLQNINGTS